MKKFGAIKIFLIPAQKIIPHRVQKLPEVLIIHKDTSPVPEGGNFGRTSIFSIDP